MNISLLAPAGLLAALSIGIVLILHMRRQTPPPRIFPSLRFWTPSESTESERQRIRRPPITWPLILQLLLAALITLALARPAVSGALAAFSGRTSPEHLIVLLDGSTSMLARNDGEQRTRFERARQTTLSLLSDWQSGDVATVLVLGTVTDTKSASNRQQISELRSWIQALSLPGGQANLNDALRLARSLTLTDRTNRIELVTDSAIQVDPDIASSVPMPIHVTDVSDGVTSDNVAITAMDARPIAGVENQYVLTVTVHNFSAGDADVPWYVEADGVEIAQNTIFLPPGGSEQVTINLPVGALQTRAAVDFSDALSADNSAMVPLQGDRLGQLDILMISDAPSRLLRALQVLPGSRVDLQPSSVTGLRDLARSYDLVVIEASSISIDDLPETPVIFVQPPAMSDRFSITGAMAGPMINSVELDDPLMAGVDLSGVTFGDTPIYSLAAGERALVTGGDGASAGPLIWTGTVNGQPYVSIAFAIADSNIDQRVAFPILIASIVGNLTANPIPMSIPVGDPVDVVTEPGAAVLEVVLPDGSQQTVSIRQDESSTEVGSLPSIIDFTGMAGLYTVRSLRVDGSLLEEGSFVVNAGQVQESNLVTNAGLQATLDLAGESSDSSVSPAPNANELWWSIALLALIVLLVEWIVAGRLLGRQRMTPRGAGT